MQVQDNGATQSVVKDKSFTPTKVIVAGVGGGGGNAVNRMINSGIVNSGITYMAFNTDEQDLRHSKAKIRCQIGSNLTKGQGAGARPEVGRKSAEENIKGIETLLSDADMVFITAGMGGGTGTGAAPVIAKVAKELGKLTIAVVTKPFGFEGRKRMQYAEQGIAELRAVADSIVVIPNQKLLQIAPNMSMEEAFYKVDEILMQGISGIADLIATKQTINLDFADVRTIMSSSGMAHMALGFGKGNKETRIKDAVYNAVNSPLLETSIEGATKVIINVVGGPGMSVAEMDEASNIIIDLVDEDVWNIVGLDIRPTMPADEVIVTLIATGFKENNDENPNMNVSYGQNGQNVFNNKNMLTNNARNYSNGIVNNTNQPINNVQNQQNNGFNNQSAISFTNFQSQNTQNTQNTNVSAHNFEVGTQNNRGIQPVGAMNVSELSANLGNTNAYKELVQQQQVHPTSNTLQTYPISNNHYQQTNANSNAYNQTQAIQSTNLAQHSNNVQLANLQQNATTSSPLVLNQQQVVPMQPNQALNPSIANHLTKTSNPMVSNNAIAQHAISSQNPQGFVQSNSLASPAINQQFARPQMPNAPQSMQQQVMQNPIQQYQQQVHTQQIAQPYPQAYAQNNGVFPQHNGYVQTPMSGQTMQPNSRVVNNRVEAVQKEQIPSFLNKLSGNK